jgi:glutathione S-transferase
VQAGAAKLVAPNVQTALAFMEAHLAEHRWFAGEHLSMADFQMSLPLKQLWSAAKTRTPGLI